MLQVVLLACSGHYDTLLHPHEGPAHPDPDRCTVATHSIFPLGGPYDGNTAVTVTGVAFQDLGDAKCRFGIDEVQARIVNSTTIECSSPGCASPTCVAGQQQTAVHVPLEVSLNGVSFTGTGLQFTYYDMQRVAVSLLTPSGGPRSGNTKLRVDGVNFRDLSSGAGGVRLQGLKCKFGSNDMVNATRKALSRTEVSCVAPPDLSWPANGTGAVAMLAMHGVPLELTFNGYDTPGSLTESRVPFSYYEPTRFNVSRVHPLGGPMDGGTELSVYLIDGRLLTDLGGGVHGVLCRFSYEEVVGDLGHERTVTRHTIVNGTLGDCKSARQCGAGWGKITCKVPPYTGPLTPAFDGADVRVEVTLNAQDYTDSGTLFRYYDAGVWRMHRFHPRGGPLRGNSSMTVSGLRFQHLGDLRCRFGVLNLETNATIVAGDTMLCASPPNWNQQASTQVVDLEVTLNGQDYLRAKMHQSEFTYYALDETPTGLSVLQLDPPGGPEAGGTLVRVSGTGFVDRGGLLCKFGLEPAVPASLVDQEHVRCYAPPRVADASGGGTFDPRSVEVTINSQLHHVTSSGVQFAYYKSEELRVSRIYPRGGPRGGGTMVTVWGIGFRELGHGNHTAGFEREGTRNLAGLHCRFGASDLVPATLGTSGGEGPQQLTCASPALPPTDRCQTEVVRVTNNANNPPGGAALTPDVVGFSYYDSWVGSDVGTASPSGRTLTGDPDGWTGDDVL